MTNYPLSATRHSYLKLGRVDNRTWSFFDCSTADPARVGPYYGTKLEAIADADRYFAEYGDN